MADIDLEAFLGDNRDAIVAGAQTRLRGDVDMGRVASQRVLSESELESQVLGFWLQAIRTDVALGSTAAIAQNLGWLDRLRSGHGLPFEDDTVMRMFDAISAEIDARLDSETLRTEHAAYHEHVVRLITDQFPGSGGGQA